MDSIGFPSEDVGPCSKDPSPKLAKQRTEVACQRCRQHKLKCDGVTPSCRNCELRHAECTYVPRQKRPRRHMRSERVQQLQERLARMERLLDNVNLPYSDSPGTLSTPSKPSTRKSVPVINTEQPVDRYVSMPTGPESELDVIGPTTPFSIFSPRGVEAINDLIGDNSFGLFVDDLLRSEGAQIAERVPKQPSPLPSNELIVTYVQFFFQQVNPIVTLFHQDSFMKSLQQHLLGRPPSEPGWYAALNIVLALVMQGDGSQRNLHSSKYINNVLTVVTELLIGPPDLFSIGALLGMGIFYFGTSDHQRALIFAGIAARIITATGMQHRNPRHYSSNDAVHRQRLFWQCFTIDQDLALLIGKPPVLNGHEFSHELPPEDDTDGIAVFHIPNSTRIVNFLREHAKLAIIHSNAYRELYSQVSVNKVGDELFASITALDDELHEWRESLPSEVRPEGLPEATPPWPIELLFLHFQYYQLLLSIHWVIVRDVTSPLTTHDATIHRSMALSISAARASICMLSVIETHYNEHPIAMILLQQLVSSVVILFVNILQHRNAPNADRDLGLIRIVVNYIHHRDVNRFANRLYKAASGMANIANKAIRAVRQHTIAEPISPPNILSVPNIARMPVMRASSFDMQMLNQQIPWSQPAMTSTFITPGETQPQTTPSPAGLDWYMPLNLNPELWNYTEWPDLSTESFDMEDPPT